MSPALKSIGAAVAAVAMVAGAVVVRGALDTKKERDDLRLTVVCDPLSEAFCNEAKRADSRLTIRVESPDRTTRTLQELPSGEVPDFQAWVSVGPWLQMADGRRQGQPPLQRDVVGVASSAIVLVTRQGQSITCTKPRPAACLPLPRTPVGLASPRTSGVGLAGLAQIVLADTGIAPADLDRGAIEAGPAAPVIDRLIRMTNPGAGLEEISANFSRANPVVTTSAQAATVAGRAGVVRSEPSVRAVLQVGILDTRAIAPLRTEAAGRALAKAATDAGWEPPGDASGGLPDPGVLAALQDAWTGP
jgi:hypothetical protein